MRYLLTRLGSLACLLAISGAALAQQDGAIQLPEPGILELGAIGAVAAVIAKLARRRK